MHLKIPPAFVFLIFGALMFLLARFLPVGYFDFTGRFYLVRALMVFGILISVLALFQFFKAKTTVNPTKPDKASKLVVSGVYKFKRKPMYLSLLVFLLAIGIYLGNAFNTLLAAGFVSYMNTFQIKPEEAVLLERFGKEYAMYLLKVRRWF